MGFFSKIKNMFKGNETTVDTNTEEVLDTDLEKNNQEEVEEKRILTEEEKKEVKVYEKGLTKSREGFVSRLAELTGRYKNVNDEYFDELEEILIMADIGVNTVMKFVDKLKHRVREEKITDSNVLKEIIVDELLIMYVDNGVMSSKINYNDNGPTVILFIGVNGVGKTTSIGKIAKKLINDGKKVLLAGGDTFRAGATEQLVEWGKKIDAPVVISKSKDPGAVIYDSIDKAIKEEYDVVLIDTAGRLQNKVNNVIKKLIPDAPHETLLVVDATTGQNGINQAKAFSEVTDITGIVLSKLDGTAKGGIVLAIKEEVGIPVKFVGLGEGDDDLESFDIEKYVYGLFKDL